MQIQIPVKNYTLKFLRRHLGENYKLSRIDAYGLHLFRMLKAPRVNARFDKTLSQYKAKFVVSIGPMQVLDFGLREAVCNWTSCMTNEFNNWVEGIFKHEFCTWVEAREEMEIPVFTAIRMFCTRFGLTEDDISQETLRTSYKRWKKKQKKQRNSSFPLAQAGRLAA